MPIKLREPQRKLEENCYATWDRGARNIMPVAPTGFGKTVLFAKFMLDEPGASTALAHRGELVSQISTAIARNGARHRILGAKKGSPLVRLINAVQTYELGYSMYDPNAKIAVGSVDTVIKMNPNEEFFARSKLLVQDEGHHILKHNKWGKAASMFPNSRGFFPTATPRRADGMGLGRHADGLVDALVEAPSMREIINMGYLTDYRYFEVDSHIDLSKVDISATTGDFVQEQMRKAVKRSTIVGDIVGHYLQHARGKLGVTFAPDVEQCEEYVRQFKARGVKAEMVTAKTPPMLRAQILRQFANRELHQLVNVDLFGEGFDLPAVECVHFGRPTQSFALYSQQFGRAVRLLLPHELSARWDEFSDEQRRYYIAHSAKPYAMIFDHVQNRLRHGLPDAKQQWSLDGREKRQTVGNIPKRICIKCYLDYERVFKECPYCGHYTPPAERSEPRFVDGDLTELDPEKLRELRGEIDRIDGDAVVPYGASQMVQMAVRKRHWERQESQKKLRDAIAWWAGLQASMGHSESWAYRKFFYTYGADVATVQTYGAGQADELCQRIIAELEKFGIDVTVNADVYFANAN